MSAQLVFFLAMLFSLVAFVSLLGAIFFWLRKKKKASVVSVVIFTLSTILTIIFAVLHFTSSEVVIPVT